MFIKSFALSCNPHWCTLMCNFTMLDLGLALIWWTRSIALLWYHLKTFPNVQIYTTFDYLHHFVRISLEVSSTFPFSLQFTICVTLWKSPSKLLQTYISKYHSVQLLMSLCENLPQIFLYFTLLYTILLLASFCENLAQNFLQYTTPVICVILGICRPAAGR